MDYNQKWNVPSNVLKYRSDTMHMIRKSYNLDTQERMEEAIDVLDNWIKKQQHFLKKEFDREYLEKLIIYSKGSVEKTKNRLDKACTMRTDMPQYFKASNDIRTEFRASFEVMKVVILPEITEDHCRILIVKMYDKPFNSKVLFENVKFALLVCEYLTKYDYSNNVIILFDYAELNILDFIKNINPIDLHQGMALFTDCLGRRVQGLHILTESKAVEAAVKLFKSLFPAKVGNRIRVHKAIETVYEHIPKYALPAAYGGEGKYSVDELHEKWLDALTTPDFVTQVNEMSKAKIDEKYRPNDSTNKENEVTGSFRKLTVD